MARVLDAPDTVGADYLLRLGDDALVLGQRLGEWCGHAPALNVPEQLTVVERFLMAP
jgi:ring-1,2-phenylacetyl-CoA epoxidase subunit PaaC